MVCCIQSRYRFGISTVSFRGFILENIRYVLFSIFLLSPHPATSRQTSPEIIPEAEQAASRTISRLNKFSRQCEKRTIRAERRMQRYKQKLASKASKQLATDTLKENLKTAVPSLGKDLLLDSLQMTYDFAGRAGMITTTTARASRQSIERSRQQLNLTQQAKKIIHREKDQLRSEYGNKNKYARLLKKADKEAYYYTARVNAYRKKLTQPIDAEQVVMDIVRSDERWNQYLSLVPRKENNPEKMQPRQLIGQMIQSQASAVDPDAMKLIADARQQSAGILDDMMDSEAGNMVDNAAQMPSFNPDPYRTAGFWDHFDAGFDMAFERQSYRLPSSGTAGLQLLYHINMRLGVGVLGNYRFGLGENIRNIRFSGMGAGYGAFANCVIICGFGVQAGFERNYHFSLTANDGQEIPAGWTSALLLGITKEYSIGKKMKGNVGVFYDFLHHRHEPQTNALLWRMGWRF